MTSLNHCMYDYMHACINKYIFQLICALITFEIITKTSYWLKCDPTELLKMKTSTSFTDSKGCERSFPLYDVVKWTEQSQSLRKHVTLLCGVWKCQSWWHELCYLWSIKALHEWYFAEGTTYMPIQVKANELQRLFTWLFTWSVHDNNNKVTRTQHT